MYCLLPVPQLQAHSGAGVWLSEKSGEGNHSGCQTSSWCFWLLHVGHAPENVLFSPFSCASCHYLYLDKVSDCFSLPCLHRFRWLIEKLEPSEIKLVGQRVKVWWGAIISNFRHGLPSLFLFHWHLNPVAGSWISTWNSVGSTAGVGNDEKDLHCL